MKNNMKRKGLVRLAKLAEFLQTVPKKKFDMSTWCQKSPDCGTVACAAGWAATMPSFRRAGFRLLQEDWFALGDGYTYFSPAYKDDEGMDAVQAFFNLNDDDAWYLFGDDTKRTPKQEAKIIQKYLEVRID